MQQKEQDIKTMPKKRFKWLKRLLVFFLIFLLLPVFISLILHISKVQNWAIQKTAHYLEDKLEEDISVGRIDFSVMKGLELQHFLIQDRPTSDTIINIDYLSVSLRENLFSLLFNKLTIKSVNLDGLQSKIIKEKTAQLTNIEELLQKLANPKDEPKKNTKKGALKLKLSDLKGQNWQVAYLDKSKNLEAEVKLQGINIGIDLLDLDSTRFILDHIELVQPYIKYHQRQEVAGLNQGGELPANTTSAKRKPYIEIGQITLLGGTFDWQNKYVPTNSKAFNTKKFTLIDLDLDARKFQLDTASNIFAQINELSFEDNNGFMVTEFSLEKGAFTNKRLELNGLDIDTKKSEIKGNFLLSYKELADLKQLANRCLTTSTIERLSVNINELSYFVPSLTKSAFINNNLDKNISIQGKLTGRLENLKGQDIVLSIPNVLDATGNFGTRNLSTSNPLINLKLEKLNTSITNLKKIIPSFNPPENFYKLGNISFKGNFDGYPKDFVAFGTLTSALGTIKTDMRLDLANGQDQATYSGAIELSKFDLYKWTSNNDLGPISFKGKVKNGKGLTAQNAYAEIDGTLLGLEYKNYQYKNININGALDKNKFEGKISSSDLNVNFGFDGYAELKDKSILFDFNADIGIIDLKALNLSKEKIVVKGKFDIEGEGKSIDEIMGSIMARDIYLQRGDSIYIFDSISVFASNESNVKSISIVFDESKIELKGKYKFNTLANDFQSIIKNNYPYHTRSWQFTPKPISYDQDVSFDINLKSYRKLLDLAQIPNSLIIDTFFAKGHLNSSKQNISLVSNIPAITINDNVIKKLFIALSSQMDQGKLNMHIDSTVIGNTLLKKVAIDATIDGDMVDLHINTNNVVDSLQKFEIGAKLKPFQNGYSMSITDNDIKIYNKRWKINADNEISLDKDYINIDNFSITDGDRQIEVIDINNKGIKLTFNKLDIELLNPFIKAKKFYFTGESFANLRVLNIFKKNPDIYGNFLMPNLKINGDSYGEVNLDISKPLDKPLDAILSVNNKANGQSIKCVATVDIKKKAVQADLKARKVPLKIVEYILINGIEQTTGTADLDGKIYGSFDDLKIRSEGVTNMASTRVLVLGETYKFSNQKFRITEREIDMNGAVITDSEGGQGNITGGLTHTYFENFFLNASIEGDNVVALNTSKLDNPAYYGKGKGKVEVSFKGDINYPNLSINAETRPGTTIKIPIQSTQTSSDKSFITFVDASTFINGNTDEFVANVVKIDGISLEMNLTLTPDAKVFLIFDENKGDIIEGIGNGNMQINMNRNGDFQIFGEYDIVEGNYLFTALSIVNKPFKVREGGKVRWNGDPVNATIDIKTDYQVKTDLTVFLSEYLVTQELFQAASNRTTVNLQMIIGNTLYNPSIKFGLEFPDLTGDLKSYADSKVRVLKNNENDLNSQVLGLVVFNSFLPSSTLSQVLVSGNLIQSASVNTLSEFISSQLSSYVTRFINESLEENGLIAGVDFDISLRNNLALQGIETNQISVVPTEIEVKLKNRFRFNDERLSFDVGGNYVRESLIRASNYVVPEFVIRYALTDDRKLNLKVYGKYDLDEFNINNRRNRIGAGIRYRTEFGSMLETKSIIKKSVKEKSDNI